MYFVKYGKEYLHDPRIDGRMLLDLTLDCEENSCGYCDFTIYPDHPMHDKLHERDASNQIEVYDDDVLLFAGFIYELGEEFYTDGHVKCKGELDYLSESIIRPYATFERGYGTLAPNTGKAYFEWLITQHNSQVLETKKFVIGVNHGSVLATNYGDDTLYVENVEYPTTIEEITEKLLNTYGGYLVVRHENGIRYIDYLNEWTDTNSQILDFGVNLTDYTQTDDAADVATFVVPLGAKMSETEYEYDDGYFETADTVVNSAKTYYTKNDSGSYSECRDLTAFDDKYVTTDDETPVSGKTYYTRNDDTYTACGSLSYFADDTTYYEFVDVIYYEYDENEDESNLLLSIEALPNGTYGENGYIKTEDIVYSTDAVREYGWIGITYKDTEVTDRNELVLAGVTALKEVVSPKRTIEIKAVDMHLVNPEMKPIRIGEYVRVRSKPHDLDSYFLCVSIDLDLNNPENSLYTLGTTFDTLTGQQNKQINKLNSTISKQYEAASSVIMQTKQTADSAKKAAENSVVRVTEQYAVSLSPDEAPDEGWSTEVPTYSEDVFVWRKMTSTYGDGTTRTGDASCINGSTGNNGEDAVLLRIDSSRGTVFKNNSISTVLSVAIYKGSERIVDSTALHATFGSGAYLEWSWQRIDETAFGIISSSDSMIGNDGFTLTISADEVDSKVTFMCQLKV